MARSNVRMDWGTGFSDHVGYSLEPSTIMVQMKSSQFSFPENYLSLNFIQ